MSSKSSKTSKKSTTSMTSTTSTTPIKSKTNNVINGINKELWLSERSKSINSSNDNRNESRNESRIDSRNESRNDSSYGKFDNRNNSINYHDSHPHSISHKNEYMSSSSNNTNMQTSTMPLNASFASSFNCPLCNLLMSSSNIPLIIAPCGHCFCKSCIVRLNNLGNNKCPMCSIIIQSYAPNTTLSMLINSMMPNNISNNANLNGLSGLNNNFNSLNLNNNNSNSQDSNIIINDNKYLETYKLSVARHNILQDEYKEKLLLFHKQTNDIKVLNDNIDTYSFQKENLEKELNRISLLLDTSINECTAINTDLNNNTTRLTYLKTELINLRNERDKNKYLSINMKLLNDGDIDKNNDILLD